MPKSLWYKIGRNQVVRFLASASVGFAVDISAFYLFYHNLFTAKTYHVLWFMLRNSTLSLSISYFLGVLVNFVMTKFVVFTESKTSASKQFIRFFAVAVLGYFANLGVLKFMTEWIGIYPPVARILAALSLFVASYFVHKIFSFSLSLRKHYEPEPHHQPGN